MRSLINFLNYQSCSNEFLSIISNPAISNTPINLLFLLSLFSFSSLLFIPIALLHLVNIQLNTLSYKHLAKACADACVLRKGWLL